MRTIAFLLGAVLFCASARGQDLRVECPAKPDSVEEARALAGSYFSQAATAYSERNLDRAVELFVCSMRMKEHRNTLFNIAETARWSTRKSHVVEQLESYLGDNPSSPLVKEIRALVAAISADVDRGETTSTSPE